MHLLVLEGWLTLPHRLQHWCGSCRARFDFLTHTGDGFDSSCWVAGEWVNLTHSVCPTDVLNTPHVGGIEESAALQQRLWTAPMSGGATR